MEELRSDLGKREQVLKANNQRFVTSMMELKKSHKVEVERLNETLSSMGSEVCYVRLHTVWALRYVMSGFIQYGLRGMSCQASYTEPYGKIKHFLRTFRHQIKKILEPFYFY